MQYPQGSALDDTLSEQHVSTHDSSRRADRVIWAGLGRAPNPRKDLPTIVVEFVSEGKRNRLRDYHEKRAEYLAAGVREYWIIDRFARTLTACRNDRPDVEIPHDGTYQTPLPPGFDLPLARLLAVAGRWRARKANSRGQVFARLHLGAGAGSMELSRHGSWDYSAGSELLTSRPSGQEPGSQA